MNSSLQKTLGIDLGTTNSAIAYIRNKTPVIIETEDGKRTVPSIVRLDLDENENIKTKLITKMCNSNNDFYATKRLLGRNFEELNDNLLKKLSYKVEPEAGKAWLSFLDKKNQTVKVPPETVAEAILKSLKEQAEKGLSKHFGSPVLVRNTVITVPAYFNHEQRKKTREAAEKAGLTVLRMINEPTAAALAYGVDKKPKTKTVAVYDLGGGTFDFSVLKIDDGFFEVLATTGDSLLGGEDFDNLLGELICKKLGIDSKKVSPLVLKEEAERVKKELSNKEVVETNQLFGLRSVQITRKELETAVAPLIEKTIDLCRKALVEAKVGIAELVSSSEKLDELLLVGGATKSPMVAEALHKAFGVKPSQGVNPDEAVALGAAVQAGMLAGDLEDFLLVDVAPMTLGIETYGGIFTSVIPANSSVPTKKTEVFTTAKDGQSDVMIRIAQGESPIFSKNKLLGSFELNGLVGNKKGKDQIQVTFAIDKDGLLKVFAETNGKNKELEIAACDYRTTESERNKLRKNFKKTNKEDKKKAAKIMAKREAEELVEETEAILKNSSLIEKKRILELEKALKSFVKLFEEEEKTICSKKVRNAKQHLQEIVSEINKSKLK